VEDASIARLIINELDEAEVNMRCHWNDTSCFISEHIKHGNVLVHCRQGQSRSRRTALDPNEGFCAQLLEEAEELGVPIEANEAGWDEMRIATEADMVPAARANLNRWGLRAKWSAGHLPGGFISPQREAARFASAGFPAANIAVELAAMLGEGSLPGVEATDAVELSTALFVLEKHVSEEAKGLQLASCFRGRILERRSEICSAHLENVAAKANATPSTTTAGEKDAAALKEGSGDQGNLSARDARDDELRARRRRGRMQGERKRWEGCSS